MKRKFLPYVAIAALATVWGGLAAIKYKNDQKAHFVEYCRDRGQVSSDIYRTVHELLKIARTKDCQAAFDRLNAQHEINLSHRGISRLEPLRGFNQIKKLTLIENQVRDLTPISGLTSLSELYVSFNKVESLTALNGLNLIILSASDNPLVDVSDLKYLPHVRFIDVSEGQIEELPDISKMENLQDLIALNNRISSNGMRRVQSGSLKFLKLDKNRIADLSFLKGLPSLVELSINSNQIKDLLALPSNVQIKALAVAGNQLTDIRPILKLPEILVVDAKANKIQKMDVPEYHGNLRRLDLRLNKIEGDVCRDNSASALCKRIVM